MVMVSGVVAIQVNARFGVSAYIPQMLPPHKSYSKVIIYMALFYFLNIFLLFILSALILSPLGKKGSVESLLCGRHYPEHFSCTISFILTYIPSK